MLDPAELLQVDLEPHWNHLDLLFLYHVIRWADDWTGRKFGSRVHGRSSRRSRRSLHLRSRDTLGLRNDDLSQSWLNAGPRDCLQPLDSSAFDFYQLFDTRYKQNAFHSQQKRLRSTRHVEAILVGFS